MQNISDEELMTTSDAAILNDVDPSNRLNSLSNLEIYEEEDQRTLSSKIWTSMKSKCWCAIVIFLVVIEVLLISAVLMIDFRVISDPNMSNKSILNANSSEIIDVSENISIAKNFFKYSSLIILFTFTIEIIIKMATGREKFITKGKNVLDAIVVFASFGLDVAFLTITDDKESAHKAALFIIIFRLWIFKDIVEKFSERKRKEFIQILSSSKRDKVHAENKVEFLILKVEDLEHEIAYLKEEVKLAERGGSKGVMAMMMSKENFTQTSPLPQPKFTNSVSNSTIVENSSEDNGIRLYQQFGQLKADEIVEEVYDDLMMLYARQTPTEKTRRVPNRKGVNYSPESGYGSTASGFQRPEKLTVCPNDLETLAQKLFPPNENKEEVSLDEDPIAVLDELLEIDRIKRMSFDSHRTKKNLPVTAL